MAIVVVVVLLFLVLGAKASSAATPPPAAASTAPPPPGRPSPARPKAVPGPRDTEKPWALDFGGVQYGSDGSIYVGGIKLPPSPAPSPASPPGQYRVDAPDFGTGERLKAPPPPPDDFRFRTPSEFGTGGLLRT